MAARPRCILLLLRDDRLAVAHVIRGDVKISEFHPFDRTATAESAKLIRQLLDEQNYAGEPVLLALGSTWCVSAAVSVPSPRQARKREAMAFLLEPHLPWSVEETVIDYELVGGDQAFMVAVQAVSLGMLIDALEQDGIPIPSLAPLGRLALAAHLEACSRIAPRYLLVWGDQDAVELWLVQDDRPVAWRWLPDDLAAVTSSLAQIALCEAKPLPIVGRDLPQDFLQAIAEQTGLELVDPPPLQSDQLLRAALDYGAKVVEGRSQAPIELRRGLLAGRDGHRSVRAPLRLLQASALILMAAIGLALVVQARHSESARLAFDEKEAILFRRLFPQQHVPVSVRTHLESELGRLKGIRGERSDLPDSVPSLVVLERLLKSLPTDLRFRLLEIRIENGQLYLVGQVRAHGDADRIADALRRSGLGVSPPNTHRLEKTGVEFRISARIPVEHSKKPVQKTT